MEAPLSPLPFLPLRSKEKKKKLTSPSITIMKIQIHIQPTLDGPLGQFKIIFQIIIPILGVIPNPLSNGIHAAGLQNLLERFLLACGIAVDFACALFDKEGGPVDAFVGEGCLGGGYEEGSGKEDEEGEGG